MDTDAIERFSGPPLAERGWVAEQARACVVRPGTDDLQTLVERDLRQRDGELAWDAWRRPDGRWTVVAAVGTAPVSTWVYDPRSRSVHPDDATSHRLASEDVVVPLRTASSTTVQADDRDADKSSARTPAADAPHTATTEDTSADDVPADITSTEEATAPDGEAPAPEPEPSEPAAAPRTKARKGRRASVPRWDEILFGAGESDA